MARPLCVLFGYLLLAASLLGGCGGNSVRRNDARASDTQGGSGGSAGSSGGASAAGTGGCGASGVPCPSAPELLACEADRDCMIAYRWHGCCSCPYSVNRRALSEDPCFYPSLDASPPPAACLDVACDPACPCENIGEALCIDGLCSAGFIPPPR